MTDSYDEQDFKNAVQDLERKRRRPRPLPHASNVIRKLLARKDYIQVGQRQQLEAAWLQAAGKELASRTRCGRLVRGTLEVIVGDSSTLMQLTFEKQGLLKKLKQIEATAEIKNLRFSTGVITPS